jgi:photosystem II stability/assembly factor-like uncharacterized protein
MQKRNLIYVVSFFILSTFLPYSSSAQWHIIDMNTEVSFRAVHALNSSTCWIGGSQGTIITTSNEGKKWKKMIVPGADSLDFRDIHAFSKSTALALSSGESEKGKARIYRTTDEGTTWKVVYETTQAGVFLDGFDFWQKGKGICFGDPIDGRFFILTTDDEGETWLELPVSQRPEALPGETAFAASGTSLITHGKSSAFIGTGGGTTARILTTEDYGQSWRATNTALPAGPSAGIFGIQFWTSKNGIAVGGDYQQPKLNSDNVLITNDGGKSWKVGEKTYPAGLKEAVGIYMQKQDNYSNSGIQISENSDKKFLIAVGPNGSSYSKNGGKSWRLLSKDAFHSVSFGGKTGYAVGANGLIARFEYLPRKKK